MRIERNYYAAAQQSMETHVSAPLTEDRIDSSSHSTRPPQKRMPLFFPGGMLDSGNPSALADSWRRFQYLSARALLLAKHCEMNIIVEQERQQAGVIQLETDYFLLFGQRFASIWSAFLELLSEADEFSISHEEKTFLIEFRFNLFGAEAER